jgi:hypothetical protein
MKREDCESVIPNFQNNFSRSVLTMGANRGNVPPPRKFTNVNLPTPLRKGKMLFSLPYAQNASRPGILYHWQLLGPILTL